MSVIGFCPTFCLSKKSKKSDPEAIAKRQERWKKSASKTMLDFGELNCEQAIFDNLVDQFQILYQKAPRHKLIKYLTQELMRAGKCDDESVDIIKDMVYFLENRIGNDLELQIDPIAKDVLIFLRNLKHAFLFFSDNDLARNEGGSWGWWIGKHAFEISAIATVIGGFLVGLYIGKSRIFRDLVDTDSQTLGENQNSGNNKPKTLNVGHYKRISLSSNAKSLISLFVKSAVERIKVICVKVPGQKLATCRPYSLAATFLANQTALDSGEKGLNKESLEAAMKSAPELVDDFRALADALINNPDFESEFKKRARDAELKRIEGYQAAEIKKAQEAASQGKTYEHKNGYDKYKEAEKRNIERLQDKGLFSSITALINWFDKNKKLETPQSIEQEAIISLIVDDRFKILKEGIDLVARGGYTNHDDDAFLCDPFFVEHKDILLDSLDKDKIKDKERLKAFISWLKAEEPDKGKPIRLRDDGIENFVSDLIFKHYLNLEGIGSLQQFLASDEFAPSVLGTLSEGTSGITSEMLGEFRAGRKPIFLSFRPDVNYDHFVSAVYTKKGDSVDIYFMDSLGSAPSQGIQDCLRALGRYFVEEGEPDFQGLEGQDLEKLERIKTDLEKEMLELEKKQKEVGKDSSGDGYLLSIKDCKSVIDRIKGTLDKSHKKNG